MITILITTILIIGLFTSPFKKKDKNEVNEFDQKLKKPKDIDSKLSKLNPLLDNLDSASQGLTI